LIRFACFEGSEEGYQPTPEVQRLLEISRRMVNDCIEFGLEYNVSAVKRLSLLPWPRRRKYDCPSYYKACAVSRATGILAARKKSLRRGKATNSPYSLKPQITAYQGFQIKDGVLRIPVGKRKFPACSADESHRFHSIGSCSDGSVLHTHLYQSQHLYL
jgi:hypothetical protein